MAKVAAKNTNATEVAKLPLITDKVYNIKVDRETQHFYIDDEVLGSYIGLFTEMTFRVLDTYTKIKAYNEDFEVKKESNLFKYMSDAIDSRGEQVIVGEDKARRCLECCGRAFGVATENFSEEEKEDNKKKASWYTIIFGVAEIKGHAPVLCDLQLSGGVQMEVGGMLKKIRDEKKDYHKAEIKFKATENPEFDWPKIEAQIDFTRELSVIGLAPLFDTIKTYVDKHNSNIVYKAKQYQENGGKNKPGKPKPKFVKKATVEDDDDSIPF